MICLGSWVGWDGQMCGITEVSQEAARGQTPSKQADDNERADHVKSSVLNVYTRVMVGLEEGNLSSLQDGDRIEE